MSLEALFASPKGGADPLQQLVNNLSRVDSVFSRLSNPLVGEQRIATNLNIAKSLKDELEGLLVSKNTNQTTAFPDFAVANTILETLDESGNTIPILLQVLLEGAWQQLQDNSMLAEEFVKEFLVLEATYKMPLLQSRSLSVESIADMQAETDYFADLRNHVYVYSSKDSREETKIKRFSVEPDFKKLSEIAATKISADTELDKIEKASLKKALDSDEDIFLWDFIVRGKITSNPRIISNPDISDFIHTVCVVRIDKTIIFIDPTNSTLVGGMIGSIEKSFPHLEIQNITHTGGKFYKGNQDTVGRNEESSRDCIDIATKIALKLKPSLQVIKQGYEVDQSKKITEESSKKIAELFKTLSNQKDTNTDLGVFNNTTIRQLQSSDATLASSTLEQLKAGDEFKQQVDKLHAEAGKLSKISSLSKLSGQVDKLKESVTSWLKPTKPGQTQEQLSGQGTEHKKPSIVTELSVEERGYLEGPDYVFPLPVNLENKYTKLHVAVQQNKFEDVKALLGKHINHNGKDLKAQFLAMQDKYGQTALHWAASKGFTEIAKLLIDAMTVDAISLVANGRFDYTALHMAVHGGNVEIVEYMLNQVAQKVNNNVKKINEFVSSVDVYGQTALHWAASNKNVKIVKLLTDKMSTNAINLKTENGNIAWDWGNAEIREIINEAEAKELMGDGLFE